MTSQTNDNAPDPYRPPVFIEGNGPVGLTGQFIGNPAANFSHYIKPIQPANGDAGPMIAGADAVRADAGLTRAILFIMALSFVAANFVVLRTVLQAPDSWSQDNILLMAMQYGFSLLTTTLAFALVGSAVLLVGYKVTGMVERLRNRKIG